MLLLLLLLLHCRCGVVSRVSAAAAAQHTPGAAPAGPGPGSSSTLHTAAGSPPRVSHEAACWWQQQPVKHRHGVCPCCRCSWLPNLDVAAPQVSLHVLMNYAGCSSFGSAHTSVIHTHTARCHQVCLHPLRHIVRHEMCLDLAAELTSCLPATTVLTPARPPAHFLNDLSQAKVPASIPAAPGVLYC